MKKSAFSLVIVLMTALCVHAHYRDFSNVDAKTFELRAGLTYKL